MEPEKKEGFECCPHCGQYKLNDEDIDPEVAKYTFEVIKKASLLANQKLKEDENSSEGYLIIRADSLSIRDYFDGMKDMAYNVIVPEDFDEIKKKLAEASLKSSNEKLHRIFRYKQEEALRCLEFLHEEFIRSDEEYAREGQKHNHRLADNSRDLLSIIKSLSKEGDASVSVSIHDIMRRCEAEGMKMGEVIRAIDWLKHEGDIFEPMRDRIQLI